jgi:hypothetical protein
MLDPVLSKDDLSALGAINRGGLLPSIERHTLAKLEDLNLIESELGGGCLGAASSRAGPQIG